MTWVLYHKKKWELQAKARQERKRRRMDAGDLPVSGVVVPVRGLGGFLRRTARSMMDMPWQIVQVSDMIKKRWEFSYPGVTLVKNACLMGAPFWCACKEFCLFCIKKNTVTNMLFMKADVTLWFQLMEMTQPGTFKLWALIGSDLHAMKLLVPRIFYVNQKTPKEGEGASKYYLQSAFFMKNYCSSKWFLYISKIKQDCKCSFWLHVDSCKFNFWKKELWSGF